VLAEFSPEDSIVPGIAVTESVAVRSVDGIDCDSITFFGSPWILESLPAFVFNLQMLHEQTHQSRLPFCFRMESQVHTPGLVAHLQL
jgi:hypothetical protein